MFPFLLLYKEGFLICGTMCQTVAQVVGIAGLTFALMILVLCFRDLYKHRND